MVFLRVQPNYGITGAFSTLNASSGRFFLLIPLQRGLSGNAPRETLPARGMQHRPVSLACKASGVLLDASSAPLAPHLVCAGRSPPSTSRRGLVRRHASSHARRRIERTPAVTHRVCGYDTDGIRRARRDRLCPRVAMHDPVHHHGFLPHEPFHHAVTHLQRGTWTDAIRVAVASVAHPIVSLDALQPSCPLA